MGGLTSRFQKLAVCKFLQIGSCNLVLIQKRYDNIYVDYVQLAGTLCFGKNRLGKY